MGARLCREGLGKGRGGERGMDPQGAEDGGREVGKLGEEARGDLFDRISGEIRVAGSKGGW